MTADAEMLTRFDRIDTQLAELKTAITGNSALGHKGIVDRLESLELLNAEVPEVHHGIESRAKEQRAVLHQRIDALERDWAKTKWFLLGIAFGAGAAGGGAFTWFANNLPG